MVKSGNPVGPTSTSSGWIGATNKHGTSGGQATTKQARKAEFGCQVGGSAADIADWRAGAPLLRPTRDKGMQVGDGFITEADKSTPIDAIAISAFTEHKPFVGLATGTVPGQRANTPSAMGGDSKKRKYQDNNVPSSKRDGHHHIRKRESTSTNNKEEDFFHKKVPPSNNSTASSYRKGSDEVIVVIDDDDDRVIKEPTKRETHEMTSRIVTCHDKAGGSSTSPALNAKAPPILSMGFQTTKPSASGNARIDSPAKAITISSNTSSRNTSQSSSKSDSSNDNNLVDSTAQPAPSRKPGRAPNNSYTKSSREVSPTGTASDISTEILSRPTSWPSSGAKRHSSRLAKACESCGNLGALSVRQGSKDRAWYCSACARRFYKRRRRCTMCFYVPDVIEAAAPNCVKCRGGTWLFVPE